MIRRKQSEIIIHEGQRIKYIRYIIDTQVDNKSRWWEFIKEEL